MTSDREGLAATRNAELIAALKSAANKPSMPKSGHVIIHYSWLRMAYEAIEDLEAEKAKRHDE